MAPVINETRFRIAVTRGFPVPHLPDSDLVFTGDAFGPVLSCPEKRPSDLSPPDHTSAEEGAIRAGGAGNSFALREPYDITIETYVVMDPRESNHSRASSARSTGSEEENSVDFVSGNPFVQVTHGIVHFFKNNEVGVPRSSEVCLLNIPAHLTIHDLLQFLRANFSAVRRIRIVRRGRQHNTYMAIVAFRDAETATEFYEHYNGVPFNTLEPDLVCQVVFVSQVEVTKEDTETCQAAPLGFTELPLCPVCLEKMDESVEGVLTVLCNHSFHRECLSQWSDTTCPVCRYTQTPPEVSAQACPTEGCGATDDLWICLICGCVGCGRYAGAHAFIHFEVTQHTYSMNLDTQRVWDYVGDNYVHRIIQNDRDGKPVEVSEYRSHNDSTIHESDKLELEYSYLLSSQLDAQRQYFEIRLSEVEHAAETELQKLAREQQALSERSATAEELVRTLTSQLNQLTRQADVTRDKMASLTARSSTVSRELAEERGINKGLTANVTSLRESLVTSQADADALREELRDLMIHLSGAEQLAASGTTAEDLASSSMTIKSSKRRPRKK